MFHQNYTLDFTEKTSFLGQGIESIVTDEVFIFSGSPRLCNQIRTSAQTFETSPDCFRTTLYWKRFELDTLLESGLSVRTVDKTVSSEAGIRELIQTTHIAADSARQLTCTLIEHSPGGDSLELSLTPSALGLEFVFIQKFAPTIKNQSLTQFNLQQTGKGSVLFWDRTAGTVSERDFAQSIQEMQEGNEKERYMQERSQFMGIRTITAADEQIFINALQTITGQTLSGFQLKRLLDHLE